MQMHGRRIVKVKIVIHPVPGNNNLKGVSDLDIPEREIIDEKKDCCSGIWQGSNFQAVVNALKSGKISGSCVSLITDNPNAYAIERARESKNPVIVIDYTSFSTREDYEQALLSAMHRVNADLFILAGYMRILGNSV